MVKQVLSQVRAALTACTGHCTPDEQGFTYHVSSWRDPQGSRMILISEMC
jgi:hypothetical protein